MSKSVTKTFVEKDGTTHMVDTQGNYFINGKCANPKSWEDAEIGENVPDFDWVETPTDVARNIAEVKF